MVDPEKVQSLSHELADFEAFVGYVLKLLSHST
jgi:hypothetical protein